MQIEQWERRLADAGADSAERITVDGVAGADSFPGATPQDQYDAGGDRVPQGIRALVYALLRALRGPAEWTALEPVPGWTTGRDGRPAAAWRFLADGSVAIRGRLSGSALGPLATLPPQARPKQDRAFVVGAAGGALTARVSVLANGVIYLEGFGTGASAWIDLDSIRFDLG